jgi:hypothetical protein
MNDDRIETAAQVLHNRRHRAGTGKSCGRCRDDARAVAEALDVDRLRGIEQRAREIRDRDVWVGESKTARYILGDDDDE